MKRGTLARATIIIASASTNNNDLARDSEMHQTKKGNEWHRGVKAHIGPDANSGYRGPEKRGELQDLHVTWYIAMKRGKLKAKTEGRLQELTAQAPHLTAKICARIEHPFHIVKELFGHRKVCYKGLAKNAAHRHSPFALANLVIANSPNSPDAPKVRPEPRPPQLRARRTARFEGPTAIRGPFSHPESAIPGGRGPVSLGRLNQRFPSRAAIMTDEYSIYV